MDSKSPWIVKLWGQRNFPRWYHNKAMMFFISKELLIRPVVFILVLPENLTPMKDGAVTALNMQCHWDVITEQLCNTNLKTNIVNQLKMMKQKLGFISINRKTRCGTKSMVSNKELLQTNLSEVASGFQLFHFNVKVLHLNSQTQLTKTKIKKLKTYQLTPLNWPKWKNKLQILKKKIPI